MSGSAVGVTRGAQEGSSRRRVLATGKTLFAFLGFSALVTEVATLLAQDRFRPSDFFSYFTVEANSLAVISLMVGAFAVATGWHARWLEIYRGAVTLYMTTTILIFIVLLSGLPPSQLTAVPWDNTVLHYIVPIVIILDWLVDRPITLVRYRSALIWLTVPLAYLFYSLVRGAIVGWYPYPFMDPSKNGYLAILVTSVVIAVVLAAITWVISSVPRWLHGSRSASSADASL